MTAAWLAALLALLLWWSLEPCTGWTDAELEACTGMSIEESQQ
jgi:hypothetical protein